MKSFLILFAAAALVAPASSQDQGPGIDLIELYELSQREGATDEQLRQMLDDKALINDKAPESPELEKTRQDMRDFFREFKEEREPKRPGQIKDDARPRQMMDGQPSDSPNPPPRWLVGLVVKPLDPALRSHFDLPDGSGVLVESVMRAGPAAKAGIKRNDIIVTADGQKISSLEGLKKAVEKSGSEGKAMNIEVIQRGTKRVVKVAPLGPESAGGSVEQSGPTNNPIFRIQRQLEAQQKEIEQLRREVRELRARIEQE